MCSKNDSIVADDDGEFVDWIELYNAGSTAYDLTGHYLSTSLDAEPGWALPSTALPANERMLIWASGKNRVVPQYHTDFRLSQSGEFLQLRDPNGGIVDTLHVGILRNNHSYGRFPDGSDKRYYFTDPTPGNPNAGVGYNGYAIAPSASKLQGFYDEAVPVLFSSGQQDHQLHYTTDGSDPTEADPVHQSLLWIDSTTVVRVRAYADSLIPSSITTNTYFIADSSTLPVISISTDPELLFSDSIGIFVPGPDADTIAPYWGANFWDDREIPVHMELYTDDRVLGLEQDLGMKVHGWVQSRAQPMKSLHMIARGDYGDAAINHKLFPQKNIRQYKRFVLRNSGGDFNHAHLRDGFLNSVMIEDGLALDMLAYRPAVLYVNGSFWGVINMREKSGDDFIESNHIGVDITNIDLLENDTTVEQGDLAAFNAMYADVMAADMDNASEYAQAASWWDLENLRDYYIAETYWNNFDWPYWNVLHWRERKDGAKWRYFLVDLDVSLNAEGWARDSKDNLGRILRNDLPYNRHLDIFKKFLEHEDFRNAFINRYADLINSTFSEPTMTQRLDALTNRLEPNLGKHFDKWGHNTVSWWRDYHINELVRGYIERKPNIARQQIQDAFGLTKQIELTVKVWPPEAGVVELNTITLDSFPWSGIYFDPVPVTLTIKPRPGFVFKSWQALNRLDQPDPNMTISYRFSQDDTLVAVFETTQQGIESLIYPNPAKDYFNVEFSLDTTANTEIVVFDVYGNAILKPLSRRLTGGLHQQRISTFGLAQGVYLVQVKTGTATRTRKVFVVRE